MDDDVHKARQCRVDGVPMRYRCVHVPGGYFMLGVGYPMCIILNNLTRIISGHEKIYGDIL